MVNRSVSKMGKEYGYIRVSTKEQNTDRQHIAMREIGLGRKNVYTDKQSGKDFERPQYQRLIRKLKEGDTLYVASINRLGRNYDEIREEWRKITKELQVDIVVLDMPLLDTRCSDGDLTKKFISDIVLQVLCYVAQIERENIRKQQAEGIAAAREKGKHLGREKIELPTNFEELVKAWRNKEICINEMLKTLSVSRSFFYAKVKEMHL